MLPVNKRPRLAVTIHSSNQAAWIQPFTSAVKMLMVEVGIVRMPMDKRRVAVPMRMLFVCCGTCGMLVLMVAIVHVAVFVLDLRMLMLVTMPFGQVEVEP